MIDRAWILVGMMGSGKSTVGRLLAELSGRTFQDTDQMIVHRLGRPISQLFSIYGEDAFRDHENSVLKSLQPGPFVLATGGGVVLREANWAELRRLGIVVYLDIAADLLIERLAKSSRKRPLLQVENWEERLRQILAERRNIYCQADIVVPLDSEDLEEAAKRVHDALLAHG